MKKKTVRTGIVGAGFAARFHFESLQQEHSTNVEVKGVYAIDTKQAAAYAKERGIIAYDGLERLIDGIYVIHICMSVVISEMEVL